MTPQNMQPIANAQCDLLVIPVLPEEAAYVRQALVDFGKLLEEADDPKDVAPEWIIDLMRLLGRHTYVARINKGALQ